VRFCKDEPGSPADEDLISAARAGSSEGIAHALAGGANVDWRDRFGCGALHWAANNGHVECARALLSAGAGVDDEVRQGTSKSSPLSLAIFSGSEDMARLLLESGANPEGIDGCMVRPLTLAVSGSEGRMMPILLAGGADPNGVDDKGASALMAAAESENYAQMELLIAAGARLGLADKKGRDAAARALAKGRPAVAAWLHGRASAIRERDDLERQLAAPGSLGAMGAASRI
jgi:ankyrin repeat protein